uniref:Putative secreted protein n=1 Tax=Amblyomma triste TaxID=251400 RepID=A0A023G415_AMBTT
MRKAACLFYIVAIFGAIVVAKCVKVKDDCSKLEDNTCRYPIACSCKEPGPPHHIRLIVYFLNHTTQRCDRKEGSGDSCNSFETQEECENNCGDYTHDSSEEDD